jgi:CheY-like chemotaxis protein/CHASE3 domain sensor protein
MNRFGVVADPARGARSRLPLPPSSVAGFSIAVIVVVLIAIVSFRSLETSVSTGQRVTSTLEVVDQLQNVLSLLKDAETGQRGFLLTGGEPYLGPYSRARSEMQGQIDNLRLLLAENPRQRQRLDALLQLAEQKFAELQQTIDLRRAGNAEGALEVVRTDRGRLVMDRIRAVLNDMQTEERTMFLRRRSDAEAAANFSVMFTWASSGLLLFLIAGAAFITSRDFRARENQIWLRTGQMGLSERLQGEQRLDVLGDHVLAFLARFMNAQVGAAYIADVGDKYRRFAGYALPPEWGNEAVRPGDGLVGQAAKERKVILVQNVPEDYLPVASGLGRGKPRQLLIAPAIIEGVVHAVLEFGFFRRVTPADIELLERASESLGMAVRSSKDRTRLEELLEETQRQAEELQAQQEELRVSNEELEEQSRALKESQAQLESQHAELEQTNSQLEEQTQLLETQRDGLAQAQSALTSRADELERASQYKSEFLANMSHELRTPLNSSLILAKLLADNKGGNLSAEQVRFAQTISSAGNDLLALINDILDLSKIEAGKVDMNIEPVALAATVESLFKSMQPDAQQKKLGYELTFEPGLPAQIETDAQRLGQILKNLLSNALKFTDKGAVSLRVMADSSGNVSFAVHDTGIGIASHQQGLIFEAFRQGDGSTHRKYGGTGLGLAISRDLARRLGGDIELQSAPGEGSVFTLKLPPVAPANVPAEGATGGPAASALTSADNAARSQRRADLQSDARSEAKERMAERPLNEARIALGTPARLTPATLRPSPIDDDRDRLKAGSRLILVIEDDVRFAAILRDLTHEMGFQCIVTHSADDGLAAATLFTPSAVLLDMNLPDHSGLGVLDQLKHNPKTRHIPVHVASVADYSKEALELGAIGYALKPVKREELVEALVKLEAKFSQGLRRVLVVEDDERQRDSIGRLLRSNDVQITGVASAKAALTALQSTTFDCMVMDLNLPDLSGYELLEQMADQHDVSFPPVIVYTGRSLTRDEEQALRRFSKSIIIKDARSPERLLDEVTLFLHQVESKLPPESQRLLAVARDRDASLDGRRVLVVEDDVRNVFALSSVLEPKGVKVVIARNGIEALAALDRSSAAGGNGIDLVLMDIMMPEMDGFTAMREIRKRPPWKKLPIIALTAKAMKDDQEKCLAAGANDYIAKPLDVEKLLSLVRVWMPK